MIVTVVVVWLFLTMPRVCMQFVIVVFPDHTHLLILTESTVESELKVTVRTVESELKVEIKCSGVQTSVDCKYSVVLLKVDSKYSG